MKGETAALESDVLCGDGDGAALLTDPGREAPPLVSVPPRGCSVARRFEAQASSMLLIAAELAAALAPVSVGGGARLLVEDDDSTIIMSSSSSAPPRWSSTGVIIGVVSMRAKREG